MTRNIVVPLAVPTCCPGAWKGKIMHTDQPLPRKSTTVKKWTRFKSGVAWVIEQSRLGNHVPTVELRRIAGLGINVTDVYRDARCYLKGFVNAVESFRIDRDDNGWRIKMGAELTATATEQELFDVPYLTPVQKATAMDTAEELERVDASTEQAALSYPALTRITTELIEHCEALLELFEGDLPRADFIRPASSKSY